MAIESYIRVNIDNLESFLASPDPSRQQFTTSTTPIIMMDESVNVIDPSSKPVDEWTREF
jgi:hypothetical protein